MSHSDTNVRSFMSAEPLLFSCCLCHVDMDLVVAAVLVMLVWIKKDF